MSGVITILNAAGAPLTGTTVTVDGTTGMTDASGRVKLQVPPVGTFVVTAAHPDHLRASFAVSVTGNGHQWNVPGHEVSGEPGAAVITIRLGRMAAAATIHVGAGTMAMTPNASAAVDRGLDEDRAAHRQALAKNPRAPLVYRSLHGTKRTMAGIAIDASNNRYWHEWLDVELDFHIGVHPLLKAPDAMGWEKLHHRVERQLLADRGDLYWVEWGVAPRPRYLVAVWCPRELTHRRVSNADVVVFFTPAVPLAAGFLDDRSPFQSDYPYTANPSTLRFLREDLPAATSSAVHHWIQRYIELGHRYLLREGGRLSATSLAVYGHWLVHQLAAAPRRALLVLPIPTPRGPWPPAEGPGLTRLLQELLLWLYRDGRLGTFGAPGGKPGTVSVPLPMSRYPAVPILGEVAIAGFSSGWSRVVQTATSPRHPSNTLYEAEATALDVAWRQIWCLDAPIHEGWTPTRLMDTISGWIDKDSSHRVARVYQTSYTGWDAKQAAASHRLLAKAPVQEVRDGKGGVRGVIRHRPDGRATLIWFDDHLRSAPPTRDQWPNFYSEGDIHQTVPKIAFGHAASLW